jgi:hypothetical protein
MTKTSYTYETKYGKKTVESATTFDINKTMMRCLVKNLAMFGLGIYIYAGEDLPESEAQAKAETQQAKAPAAAKPAPASSSLIDLKEETPNWDAVLKYVNDNKELGIEAIGKQLIRKYKISPALKKKLAEICKS